MSLITRLKESIAETRERENMRATIAKQQALLEYVAIMADVEIDEEDEEVEDHE